jgi:ATP adenylyltransferase
MSMDDVTREQAWHCLQDGHGHILQFLISSLPASCVETEHPYSACCIISILTYL